MTVLKRDPRYPIVWRSPAALQIGSRPLIVLDPVTPVEERVIAALRKGVPADSLAVLARCTQREAADLVGRLAPALGTAPVPGPPSLVVRARDEQGRQLGALARELGMLGTASGAAGASRGGIAVGAYAIPAAVYRDWLRDGVSHVGVILAERAVHVSPVVVPGRTPCLRCADLQRRDADPAWPAVAAQLIDCPAGAAEDSLAPLAAIASAVRRLTAALGNPPRGAGDSSDARGSRDSSESGSSWIRFDISGDTTTVAARAHPECGCLVDLSAAVRAAA